MITITLKGKCTAIKCGGREPGQCMLTVQLDQYLAELVRPCDVQVSLPVEFAKLFEVGRTTNLRLDQDAI
jgi:hypothetical protein